MIAHFVGGPLHGMDRVVENSQWTIEIYQLDHPTALERLEARADREADDLPAPTVDYITGRYERIRVRVPDSVPSIFVWMEEQPPYRFVATVE